MLLVWTGNPCPHYKTKKMPILWRNTIMFKGKTIIVNKVGGSYMIMKISQRTLKHICKLYGIRLIDPQIRGYRCVALNPDDIHLFISAFTENGYEVIFA